MRTILRNGFRSKWRGEVPNEWNRVALICSFRYSEQATQQAAMALRRPSVRTTLPPRQCPKLVVGKLFGTTKLQAPQYFFGSRLGASNNSYSVSLHTSANGSRLVRHVRFWVHEMHYTPKKGSWLNIAELELSVLSRSCLGRQISSVEKLDDEVQAIVKESNEQQCKVTWQFSIPQAREKLKRRYEKVKPNN